MQIEYISRRVKQGGREEGGRVEDQHCWPHIRLYTDVFLACLSQQCWLYALFMLNPRVIAMTQAVSYDLCIVKATPKTTNDI